jgi:hypothetical protein
MRDLAAVSCAMAKVLSASALRISSAAAALCAAKYRSCEDWGTTVLCPDVTADTGAVGEEAAVFPVQ